MGVIHGDEAVVRVFVTAFGNNAVLHSFFAVNQCPLRYDGDREPIDLTDTLVMTVRVTLANRIIQCSPARSSPRANTL